MRSDFSIKAFVACAAFVLCVRIADAAPQTGLQQDVRFDVYSPLASNGGLIDRMFRPLLAERLRSELGAAEQANAQSIDLAQERFAVYVPTTPMPTAGYGLMVFISAFPGAVISQKWFSVLDKHGIICVMAAEAGNHANVFTRRIPLALTAYANAVQRYRIDSNRVVIGGLSGGARVAQRIGFAFPDVFNGVLLNSSSDRYGSDVLPPPAVALLRQFQEHTRIVYATGTRDEGILELDRHSRDSARDLCIFDVRSVPMNGRGHQLIEPGDLDRSFTELEDVRKPDQRIAECRVRRAQALEAAIARVSATIAGGNKEEGARQLQQLDEEFGGEALPRSLELAHKL